jgi:hypothetical protein
LQHSKNYDLYKDNENVAFLIYDTEYNQILTPEQLLLRRIDAEELKKRLRDEIKRQRGLRWLTTEEEKSLLRQSGAEEETGRSDERAKKGDTGASPQDVSGAEPVQGELSKSPEFAGEVVEKKQPAYSPIQQKQIDKINKEYSELIAKKEAAIVQTEKDMRGDGEQIEFAGVTLKLQRTNERSTEYFTEAKLQDIRRRAESRSGTDIPGSSGRVTENGPGEQ